MKTKTGRFYRCRLLALFLFFFSPVNLCCLAFTPVRRNSVAVPFHPCRSNNNDNSHNKNNGCNSFSDALIRSSSSSSSSSKMGGNQRRINHELPILRLRTSFARRMLPEDSLQSGSAACSIWQAVEVFDGSTVLDPVVVSSVFWSSLKTKILSVLVGQVIATAVVGLLTFFFSSQLVAFGNYVSQKGLFFLKDQDKDKDRDKDRGKEWSTNAVSSAVSTSPSQMIARSPDVGKLLLCLVIDILGTSSELIPFVGELTDVAYAPLAAFALRYLFQGSNVIFALEFVEEILPFTDVLPLATLCWILETYFGETDIAKLLQIGTYSNTTTTNLKRGDIIDVEQVVKQDQNKY